MTRRALAFLGIVGACAPASDAPADDGCLPGDAPTLDLGAGASAYEPLDDGDTVELIHGAQGGFHVVIALDGEGLDVAEGSRAPAVLTGAIDGVPTASTSPYLDFRCNKLTGSMQSFGTLLIFTPTEAQLQGLSVPEYLDGRTVEIHAELTDRSGRVVSADRTVVIHDPLLEGTP